MKKISVLFAVLFTATTAFAEAPELKNMMPNSWEMLTRLSESEEKKFLEQQEIASDLKTVYEEFSEKTNNKIDQRVYLEKECGLEFYRVLICNENLTDFLNTEYKDKEITLNEYDYMRDIELSQKVYMKNKSGKYVCIASPWFHVYWVSQGEWEGFDFYDLMIKPLNKNEIGFFLTEAKVDFCVEDITKPKTKLSYKKTKNQQEGFSRTYFSKYKINEDIRSALKNDYVRIDASHYLFDSKCPLKYSIQNAFDGNPATSYVENTEDDLIQITFPGYEKEYNGEFKIAIINGYAKNETLYTNNNRVKNISVVSYKVNENKTELIKREPIVISLDDNCLKNQTKKIKFLGLGQFCFNISEIFKGIKYNDTCIAEINYCDCTGWQFGDIND